MSNIPLYPYQEEGVKYILKHGGGFLWDEPGMGKTRQAIVAAKRLGGPVLVVTPNSVKTWWRKAIENLFPDDKIMVAGVGGRFEKLNERVRLNVLAAEGGFPFWTVVHYTGLRLALDDYKSIRWSTVIVDESHFIKNRKAQRTKAVKEVTPPLAYRIGLTATPFGKNPADLWSQLNWLVPEVPALRSYWKFYNAFVDYDYIRRGKARYRDVKGAKNLDVLAELMAGYGIRRTKDMVRDDLPPLLDIAVPLDLEGKQRALYNQVKKRTTVEIEMEGDEEVMVIPNQLARLTRLEQILSHPWTFQSGLNCAKLEWLKDWGTSYKKPAVIATRFKASAKTVAEKLGCRSAITGDLPQSLRGTVQDRWEKGEEQFLVGTIHTIGTGLNLTPAHALVLYDQVHDPILMAQARQRVHRIVTDHPVNVYYLYTENTTNQVVLASFLKRWKSIETVNHFLELMQTGKAVSIDMSELHKHKPEGIEQVMEAKDG
jgi:SWI/SNF-related matrix-associated actin-dependent regulator 1 of chromatin subfamily A